MKDLVNLTNKIDSLPNWGDKSTIYELQVYIYLK